VLGQQLPQFRATLHPGGAVVSLGGMAVSISPLVGLPFVILGLIASLLLKSVWLEKGSRTGNAAEKIEFAAGMWFFACKWE